MRLLGIKVQGEYTSEANVFASLLGHRPSDLDATVVYHSIASSNGIEKFRERSRANVEARDLGLRATGQPQSSVSKLRSTFDYRMKFGRVIEFARQYQPDIVYSSQQFWDSALSNAVSRALRIPQVVHLHFNVGPWLSTGFSSTPRAFDATRRLLGLTDPLDSIRNCAHVVTVSDFLREQVIEFGVPSARVTTVHNSMSTTQASPGARERIRAELKLGDDVVLIAHVGALLASKGQIETIQAFGRLSNQFPQAHLVVVGDGPEGANIAALIRELRLESRVHTTGRRSDVADILAASDIFAHPSKRDPFPLAILEGLSAAMPVVAWADGGVKEQIVDGETGFLVKTGSVEGLADSFQTLLADPSRRKAMGQRAREHVESHCHPDRASASFAEVLRKTIAPGR